MEEFAGIRQATVGAGKAEETLESSKGEQSTNSNQLVHYPVGGAARFLLSMFIQGSELVPHMIRSIQAAPQNIWYIIG